MNETRNTDLIKNDMGHALQLRVSLKSTEQDTRGHEQKSSVLRCAPFQPDLVPHCAPDRFSSLGGNTFRNTFRRDDTERTCRETRPLRSHVNTGATTPGRTLASPQRRASKRTTHAQISLVPKQKTSWLFANHTMLGSFL